MRNMKDSGIEWIGSIPSDWFLHPAKYSFVESRTKNTDGQITKALKFFNGNIIEKENFDAESDDYVAETITNYTIVEPDTIMINGLNLNYDLKSRRVGLVKNKGVITSAYLALRPDINKILPNYATYLFKGYEAKMAFHNMGSGIRKTLGFKEFKNQPVLYPPIKEQLRIVRFLDQQCSIIEKTIDRTKSSIEEYKKLMQAIITRAVTKGVRGERPSRNSGVVWIGEIPEEWTALNFKYVATVKANLVHPSDFTDYPQIAPDNIEKGTSRLLNYKTVGEVGIESDNHLFYKGQILYSKIRPILNKVIIAPFDGLCSADMYPIETTINKQYLVYMMLSDVFLSQVKLVTEDRVKMPKINQEELGQIKICLPPEDEQVEIVKYLNSKITSINHLMESKEKFLAELESYKRSMIYEYVTGKKEA